MSTLPLKPYYRNDIDGLRAIAVSLVILFHFNFALLPSGFIGVDIFFVISGFLITGIIITQIKESRFSLSDFFVRRLWRIQPALISLGIITLGASSLLMLPEDFILFAKSEKYNALFLANQFFAKQSATYASPQSDFFPLLHTWSLSVEWQWYLILPLVITLTMWAVKRFNMTRFALGNDKTMLWLWGGCTVVLAILSLLLSKNHPGQTYYNLSARMFEFAIGGTTFISTRLYKKINAKLSILLSFISILAIILIATSNNNLSVYPNEFTLLVSVFSALFIFTGHYNVSGANRVLSLPVFAYIGRLSYSLYLWHWPVLAYCRYADIPLTSMYLSAAVLLILTLSLISYYLIEKPLRKTHFKVSLSILILVVIPIVFYSALYQLADKKDGFPQRLGATYTNQLDILNQYKIKSGNRINCLSGEASPENCTLGDLASKNTAILIGDSNSNHFWNFFDVLAKDAKIKMTAVSESSCLTLPGVWQYDWWVYRNEKYQACHDSTEKFYNLIKKNHYHYVIIGEVWENYINGPYLINKDGDQRSDALTKERMRNATIEAFSLIVSTGATPVIIKTIYPMPAGYQECLQHQATFRNKLSTENCGYMRPMGSEDPFLTALFNEMKEKFPTLIIIDPKDVQCVDKKCITQIDSIPVYRDVGHLTDFSSYWFGENYLQKIGNPLKPIK